MLNTPTKSHTFVIYVDGVQNMSQSGPPSSEISDFTPYAHAPSDFLHVKCTHKTDH